MPTSDQELLARAIEASGLSSGDYARQVLIRDPRQVRRWLAGTLPIPKAVRDHLEQLEQNRLEARTMLVEFTEPTRAQDQTEQSPLGQEPTSQPPKPWWHYWSGKAD